MEQRGDEGSGEGEGARGSRVYGVSFTRWPSPFIANLLNETCRAYIVRLLVPSVAQFTPTRGLETVYRFCRSLEIKPKWIYVLLSSVTILSYYVTRYSEIEIDIISMNSGEVGKNDVLVFIGDHRCVSYIPSYFYTTSRGSTSSKLQVLIFTKI